MQKFRAHTLQEHQLAIAQYLPNDKVFAAKNIKESNLYKILLSFSGEFKRLDEIFQSVWDGTNLLTTNDLEYIALWEGFVRIPDNIFTETTSLTLEERRSNILLKLRGLGVLTEQDFINLAAILGETIIITHGTDVQYPPYDVPFIPMGPGGTPFVWLITGASVGSKIEPLFQELKPEMTILLFL